MRLTLRFLLTLLLILPLISCDKDQIDELKELKITPSPTATPSAEPTILGLWREGPMGMSDNLDMTITFERIENESIIETIVLCDLEEIEQEHDFSDLQKSYLFHFFQNGELNIHITIHMPDNSECIADTMDEIPYVLSEHDSLLIDGRYVGFVDFRSYKEIDLMTGPI